MEPATISLISGLTGVAVGGGIALYGGHLDRKHRSQEAQAEREHARKLAIQDRVASSYEDMLEFVGWQMEVIAHTRPIFGTGATGPAEPEREKIRRVEARIGVHGSPEAKEVLKRWSAKVHEFFHCVSELDLMEQDSSDPEKMKAHWGASLADQRKLIEQVRGELHGVVRELEDVVNAELRD